MSENVLAPPKINFRFWQHFLRIGEVRASLWSRHFENIVQQSYREGEKRPECTADRNTLLF